jgi:circadian clock protein KaiC
VVPIDGLSALADNLILLRQVELRSQLYRLLSILKVRASDYDTSIREFQITNQGIEVETTFESADAILTGIARTTGARSGQRRRRPE